MTEYTDNMFWEFLLALIVAAMGIFYLYCAWRIFEKAKQPGWALLIPVYNFYIFSKIIGKPWWWTILLCFGWLAAMVCLYTEGQDGFAIAGVLSLAFAAWNLNLLSKSFGKDEGFTFCLVFFGYIFLPILALTDKIRYQGPAGNPIHNINDQIESIGADLK